MQRTWFGRVTDTYLRVPLSYFGSPPRPASCWPTPTPTSSGRSRCSAPAVLARRVVLIGLSIVSLAADRPAADAGGAGAVPGAGDPEPDLQPPGRGPGRDDPGAAGRGVGRGPRVVRGRARGQDARPRGPRGRPPAPAPPASLRTARLGGRPAAGHVRARPRRPAQPRDDRPARRGGLAASRRARSRPASWSRRWRCSASSRSPCGSWASCSRRCPGPWSPPTGSTDGPRHAVRAPAPRPDGQPDAAAGRGRWRSRSRALRFGYGGRRAGAAGVDLTLAPGEVVALVGATGSGKSTLCHLLAHLYEPTRGSVRLGRRRPGRRRAGVGAAHVALAFQEAFLFGDTVRENLALGEDASATTSCAGRSSAARAERLRRPAARTASTSRWASGASRCRAASASAWPWPGPCCAGPAC